MVSALMVGVIVIDVYSGSSVLTGTSFIVMYTVDAVLRMKLPV
jgi:hypothetical protein